MNRNHLLTLLIWMICSGCISPTAPAVTPTPSSLPLEQKTAAPTSPPHSLTADSLRQELRDTLLGEVKDVQFDTLGEPGDIYIRWKLLGSYSHARFVDYAKEDTVTILRTVAESDLDFHEVQLSAWYDMTIDIDGKAENTQLIHLFYSLATLDRVDWEKVKSEHIWIIADRGTVHWILED